MNKTVKKRWIEALRSGEYKQGHAALHRVDVNDQDFWCCLGVLLDTEVDGEWVLDNEQSGYYALHGKKTTLTPEQRHDFELSLGEIDTLMSMNDRGKDFATIADWIEAHL